MVMVVRGPGMKKRELWYRSAERVSSPKVSLGLAFRENRNVIPIPCHESSGDEKGRNNKKANCKTGNDENSSKWDEILELMVTPS
jgi:hypothetical protein